MKKVIYLAILALVLGSLPLVVKAKPEDVQVSPFTIGEKVTFHSAILNENRMLNVYLPASYAENADKEYPVIYLLDGSADEDFVHLAGLVQFGSMSWIKLLPETIVVGIANVDRKRDFTYPSDNQQDIEEFPSHGGSASFIKAIREEIQPLVEEKYRTSAEKTIIGQSLGGLLATEILLGSPALFDHYIIISPSLWWDDESLLSLEPTPLNPAKSVYVGVGKEGPTMERVAKALFEKIEGAKPEGTSVYFSFFEQLDHGDTLHLAAYDAFDKVFKAKTK
ncbi:alpha/beta hydrolase [Lacimicrobium alkaliphilum]|uniref:Esterase n=1 Tax=Lacimicrobium alkaliphilum TaxID=1526571 RepID=A0ABQ1RTW0_9ALTE|nr:alpha/beta hydrolase-fold protein [Lacimicrobium alkaliphilum]GGD78647.1 esterase [Lacimicrobium alkaliphilum]